MPRPDHNHPLIESAGFTGTNSTARRPWLAGAAAVFIVYALLLAGRYPAKNPNELSRIELSAALVHERSISIDAVARDYGKPQDRSVRDGKTYCDKAPGLSVLAAPVFAAVGPALPAHRKNDHAAPSALPDYWSTRHILTGLLVALPGAVLPFALLRRYPVLTPRARLALAVLFALATPLLTYATVFFGHVPSAVFCAAAYVLALGPGRPDHRPSSVAAGLAGLLSGAAVATEYPTALIGGVILAAMIFRRTPPRTIGAFLVGGLVAGIPLLVYHHAAFGSIWATGYSFKGDVKHAQVHAEGIFGVAVPTFERLWGVLFSARRGVFYYCPLLILAPIGLALMFRDRRRDAAALVGVALVMVAFGAGFVDWRGGWCAAARHLTPLIPLLIFPTASAVEWLCRRSWTFGVLMVLAAFSLSATWLSIAVTPFFPERFDAPLGQIAAPSLFDGVAARTVPSEWLGAPRVVGVIIIGVLAAALVGGALMRLAAASSLPRVPALALLGVGLAVHLLMVRSSAPPLDTKQQTMKAFVLQRLDYQDKADALRDQIRRELDGGSE